MCNKFWRYLDNKVVKDEINDLNSVGDGKELLRQLILIGRSDNLAQSPKMTAESLRMLDKFELMIK